MRLVAVFRVTVVSGERAGRTPEGPAPRQHRCVQQHWERWLATPDDGFHISLKV
jgi:hypothetical protein